MDNAESMNILAVRFGNKLKRKPLKVDGNKLYFPCDGYDIINVFEAVLQTVVGYYIDYYEKEEEEVSATGFGCEFWSKFIVSDGITSYEVIAKKEKEVLEIIV